MTTQAGERRKVREGRVVSDHMDKSVIVAVERRVQHRLYGKSMRHISKFVAHDETNTYQVGDVVRIVETRPLSKTKHWRVVELLVRREVPDVSPEVAAEVLPEAEAVPAPRRRGPTRAAQRAAAKRAEEAGTPTPPTPAPKPRAKKAAAAEIVETEAEEAPVAEAEEAPVAEAEEAPVAEAEEAPVVETETVDVVAETPEDEPSAVEPEFEETEETSDDVTTEETDEKEEESKS